MKYIKSVNQIQNCQSISEEAIPEEPILSSGAPSPKKVKKTKPISLSDH